MEFRPKDRFVVAERFIGLRTKAHFTQARLGQLLGVCRQTVSEIESQRVRLHRSTWDRFVEFESKHKQPPIDLQGHWS
jgi:plasmid maintenance system antidote protein VapI